MAAEERALRVLARVVAERPFRARELIVGVCDRTRDAFGLERVEWRPPHELVAVPEEGEPSLDEHDKTVLGALGEAAAALADRARAVTRADRLKNDFVSVASHELRTPISVVHGIATTLHERQGELDDQNVLHLLGSLVQQTARLRDLADQLLDLSHIDAAGLLIRPEPLRPRERLDELLPRIAGERLGDVDVRVHPGDELTTDPVAFERVAGNLILNALRYGRPPIEVRGKQGDTYLLVVEDRGRGVEPEFVPQLFDRFSRSDDSRRSGTPGTGLGLAIAAAYAEAAGGSLAYEPARPHGARFTLSLPAARR